MAEQYAPAREADRTTVTPCIPRMARIYSLVIALASLSALPASTAAQAVAGTLRNADTGQPLPGAPLYLVSDHGEVADSTRTGPQGGFRLVAPLHGTYTVVFQMDGWTTVPSQRFELSVGATHDLEFAVPLISISALEQMGHLMRMEPDLMEALPEICRACSRCHSCGTTRRWCRSRGWRSAGTRCAWRPTRWS